MLILSRILIIAAFKLFFTITTGGGGVKEVRTPQNFEMMIKSNVYEQPLVGTTTKY